MNFVKEQKGITIHLLFEDKLKALEKGEINLEDIVNPPPLTFGGSGGLLCQDDKKELENSSSFFKYMAPLGIEPRSRDYESPARPSSYGAVF